MLNTELNIPKNNSTEFYAEVGLSTGGVADVIAPKAPDNIKQIDFIKSILAQLNMYAYTETNNPKHLIFQK